MPDHGQEDEIDTIYHSGRVTEIHHSKKPLCVCVCSVEYYNKKCIHLLIHQPHIQRGHLENSSSLLPQRLLLPNM